jgi:hypothetical protein
MQPYKKKSCTMFYNGGHCCAREESPSQISSQNRTFISQFKKPLLKKHHLTHIKPFQKKKENPLVLSQLAAMFYP